MTEEKNSVSFNVTIGDDDTLNEVELDNWEPSDMRLSPSKINLFLQCPKSFYYRYIAKLPEKLTLHLFRGTIVHDLLEIIFTQKFKYASGWRNDEPAEWAVLEFRKRWTKLKTEKSWLFDMDKNGGLDGDLMEKESIDLLINFCHRVQKKVEELTDWKVARTRDMAFNQLKPKFAEMRVHNKELKIMGIVDVVVKDFEDNISIIDYKTSKRYGSWLPEDYYRQLIIYSLLYYEETGVKPKFAGIHWLRYDDLYMVHVTDDTLSEARQLIKGIHDELSQRGVDEENFNVVPQKLCKWCAFYKNPCEPGPLPR